MTASAAAMRATCSLRVDATHEHTQCPLAHALQALAESQRPHASPADHGESSSNRYAEALDTAAAAVRDEEARLDAEAAERCTRFKIHLVCGSFQKALANRAKYASRFDAATVGVHQANVLQPDAGLASTLKPGSLLVVEKANGIVALRPDDRARLNVKLVALARDAGFAPSERDLNLAPFLMCLERVGDSRASAAAAASA